MFLLKKLAAYVFNKCYSIEDLEYKRDDEEYACEGRIIRSLSDTKKEACAANVFYGLK